MKYTILAYSNIDKTSLEYTIIFDAVTGVSESYTNQITAFVVEDGGVITDHAIKSKDKINVEGIVTDLSFNQGDDGLVMFAPDGSIQVTRSESWSLKTKKALRDINERVLPCSVKSSYKEDGKEVIESEVFPCLIESLNLDVTSGETGVVQPKIVLVPVRIARLEFTALTAEQQAIPELKNENNRANAAKSTSGNTDKDGKDKKGEGESEAEDSKLVDLGLKSTAAEQTAENKSMLSEISDKSRSLVNTGIKSEMAVTQAEINKVEGRIKQLQSGK